MSALNRAPKLVDRNGKLSLGLRSAKGLRADWGGTARVQRIVLGILQHSAAVLIVLLFSRNLLSASVRALVSF
jgi:hypothetical protein